MTTTTTMMTIIYTICAQPREAGPQARLDPCVASRVPSRVASRVSLAMEMRGKTEPKDVPLPHVRELNREVIDQIYAATGVTASMRARWNRGRGPGEKLVCSGPNAQLAIGEALAIDYIQGLGGGGAGGGGGGGGGPWDALPPATPDVQQQHRLERGERRARDSGHFQFLQADPLVCSPSLTPPPGTPRSRNMPP